MGYKAGWRRTRAAISRAVKKKEEATVSYWGLFKKAVSAYIDYAHRLKTEDFGPYFAGEKKLMPKPTDLSYYNWETQASTHNSTPNFQVVADQEGLLFKNKRDRKVVNVDPAAPPGDNSSRNELECEDYLQVTIFDHLTRRKN